MRKTVDEYLQQMKAKLPKCGHLQGEAKAEVIDTGPRDISRLGQ